MKDDGTITVPSFDLPYSDYASVESREYVVGQFPNPPAKLSNIVEARRGVETRFYRPKVERLSQQYPYVSQRSVLGGVTVESFEPQAGIAPENQHRVLLNLHGGPKNPLAVPAASAEILKAFPPTLFITGSRAVEMSAAAQSHLELLELGVKSQLLIFDGMEHGFILYPIPEATRAHQLVVKFFHDNLGSQPAENQ